MIDRRVAGLPANHAKPEGETGAKAPLLAQRHPGVPQHLGSPPTVFHAHCLGFSAFTPL
jgi:hypothetical protein